MSDEELRQVRLAAYVSGVVDQAPALKPEQVDKLRMILTTGSIHAPAGRVARECGEPRIAS